ncbi:MAG: hypothetical protein C4309_06820 [Chloroflexota bacterium]
MQTEVKSVLQSGIGETPFQKPGFWNGACRWLTYGAICSILLCTIAPEAETVVGQVIACLARMGRWARMDAIA